MVEIDPLFMEIYPNEVYDIRADLQVQSRVLGDKFRLTSTWTDDVLGASSITKGEHQAKDKLWLSYEIKDLGEARFILGIQVDRD